MPILRLRPGCIGDSPNTPGLVGYAHGGFRDIPFLPAPPGAAQPIHPTMFQQFLVRHCQQIIARTGPWFAAPVPVHNSSFTSLFSVKQPPLDGLIPMQNEGIIA
jgi:hypothetical protein